MSTVGWLLVVAVGIALGFSGGRLWPGSSARLTALERERNAAREDLQNYRQEVSQHFERTAELFDKVTSDYRNLYEHLARSERQLGAFRGESTGSSLAQPEQRRLTANAPAPTAAPTVAPTVAEVAAGGTATAEAETMQSHDAIEDSVADPDRDESHPADASEADLATRSTEEPVPEDAAEPRDTISGARGESAMPAADDEQDGTDEDGAVPRRQ